MSDEPPHRPVTEGEARELRPVVAELLRDAPAGWSVRDPAGMTADQERALYLLSAAAFVERRFRLRFSMATAKSSIETVFAATGVQGFMEAIEPAVAKAWGAWQDDWREWASGETRGTMPFAVERLPPDEWRLTAEGRLAQSDIVNGDDGPVDFVLWRGLFDGQRRLTIHRRPIAGHGVLEKLTMHDGAPELQRVAVANWPEGGEALRSTIETALADSLAAYFKKKADEEAPTTPADGNGDVIAINAAKVFAGEPAPRSVLVATRGANHADAEKKRKPRHSGDTARVVDSYPDELVKRIVKARSDYTRTRRDLRHPVVPQNQWLYDWCCENDINVSKTFPVAFDGEDFCDRARRFWDAMRKRRSRRA